MSKKKTKNNECNAPTPKALTRLCTQLALNTEQTAAFTLALTSGDASRRALVLSSKAPADYQPPFACLDTSGSDWAWLPPRCYIPADATLKLAQYEDYKQGLYYLLDLSSCWESAPLSHIAPPARALDLCAAPGGKSMLALARFGQTAEYVCNEIHPSRRGILRDNMTLCGHTQVEITGLRPDQWSEQEREFDLILVDAPCSGQSLLAKGIKNPGCLGSSMTNGNAKRQKGILLSILPRLAQGGHLLYSTCTYTPEENEKVIAYLLKRHPQLIACEVASLASYRSPLSAFASYRLLPMHGYGAGGFCCLLQRQA